MIAENHTLRQFFSSLVEKHFSEEAGIRDEQVMQYVTNLLTDFCEGDQLFRLVNAQGRNVTDVGEMLLEADPVYGSAPSFDRERQVRKHIGDFTLFFTGMYPESINHSRLRKQRMENFVDFVKAGKESYHIVSKFDCFEYAKVAPMFKSLAEHFEACVYGLNIVKNELEVMQHIITQRRNEFVM